MNVSCQYERDQDLPQETSPYLAVREGQVLSLVLEGYQAGVEPDTTVVVVRGAEAREARRAQSGSVGQAQDLQPPVGPDVGQAVVAVVQTGEHVEVESSLVWVEQFTEIH